MLSKRIVVTSNTSFSLYNFRLGLMRHMKENGFEVIVLAPFDDYTKLLEKEFIYYPIKHLDRKGTNPLKDFLLFTEYLKYYMKLKPNVVFNYTIKPNIYSSFACGILRIPCVSVVTGLGYVFVRGGFLKKLVVCLYKCAFRFNNYIVVLNPDDFDVISNIAGRDKVKLIKSEGVNTDFFTPEFCKEGKKTDAEYPVFLFIGRFLKEKGIYELIEAGKRLWEEGFRFEIWFLGKVDLGNPSSITEEDLIKFRSFEFVKIFQFTSDVRPFICEADCVVLPSYYREGIPRVLLETMAMERPIITTDMPGCREVVIDGVNGFLVKPQDVEDLSRAMKKFIYLTREKKLAMGKKSRDIVVLDFDEKKVISFFLQLSKELITGM